MDIKDVDQLLEPGYVLLETGVKRLPDGTLVAAALHGMHGCSVAMVQWWLTRKKTQEEFVRWHPLDHVSIEWRDGVSFPVHREGGRVIGRFQPRPISEIFAEADLARSDATVFLHARGGPAESDVWTMRVAQVGRDTVYGCEVRSRFWIGQLEPLDAKLPQELMEVILSEANALWQMKHCLEEYHYLSEFLPQLYAREGPRAGR